MKTVFVVVYYNTDEVENSEVIGVCDDKESAVSMLIKAAHYDEKDGVLRQYRMITNDYQSYQELYDKAFLEMQITDHDVYRIEETTH